MVGDKIIIKPEYKALSTEIFDTLKEDNFFEEGKKVIAIGGESGSGKSVTAVGLSQVLTENNISNVILHQDDYFHLPPKSNHQNRLLDIKNVGLHEVNLDLMHQHTLAFKKGDDLLTKPLVKYQENLIISQELNISNTQVLILEGTYVLDFESSDYKVFIDRSYKDTLEQRLNRNRDIIDDFTNNVLEIEHQIIKEYIHVADGVIDINYAFKTAKK